MGRIRTVKPELLTHEDLFMLEKETGLPVRLAFVGLFTVCDREGRFKWQPNRIKLAVLPYDELDFSRVLDALATRGFIRMYSIKDEIFGLIPTWSKHQVINNRESSSEIPEPEESDYISMTSTREARVDDATGTPLVHASGEGKGREGERKGKGKGTEGVKTFAPAVAGAAKKNGDRELPNPLNLSTWQSYKRAYAERYGVAPVQDAPTNAKIKTIVKGLGSEAPDVAEFFVSHNGQRYVAGMHQIGMLVVDYAKLRTEWMTNTKMTNAKAQQADKTATNLDSFAPLIAAAKAREEAERKENA